MHRASVASLRSCCVAQSGNLFGIRRINPRFSFLFFAASGLSQRVPYRLQTSPESNRFCRECISRSFEPRNKVLALIVHPCFGRQGKRSPSIVERVNVFDLACLFFLFVEDDFFRLKAFGVVSKAPDQVIIAVLRNGDALNNLRFVGVFQHGFGQ